MLYVGTLLTLFAPALVASGLHLRISREKRTPGRFAYWLFLYAFAIAALLGVLKILRGKGEINLVDSFNTVNNLVKYGLIALVLSLVLPFFWRLFYLIYNRVAHVLARHSGRIVWALLGGLLDDNAPQPEAAVRVDVEPLREVAAISKTGSEEMPAARVPVAGSEEMPAIRVPMASSGEMPAVHVPMADSREAFAVSAKTATEETPPAPQADLFEEELRAAERARKIQESFAAQEAEMAVEVAKVVPKRRSSDGPKKMLYNISVRDTKVAPKTWRQRVTPVIVYSLISLLVFIIVYGVLVYGH